MRLVEKINEIIGCFTEPPKPSDPPMWELSREVERDEKIRKDSTRVLHYLLLYDMKSVLGDFWDLIQDKTTADKMADKWVNRAEASKLY